MSDFAHAFTFMGDHVGLLWHKTLETLALSSAAVGMALLIGLPLGLLLGHLHRGSFVAINASNILRASTRSTTIESARTEDSRSHPSQSSPPSNPSPARSSAATDSADSSTSTTESQRGPGI